MTEGVTAAGAAGLTLGVGRGGSERIGATDFTAACGVSTAGFLSSDISAAPVDPNTKVLDRFCFFGGEDAVGRGAALIIPCEEGCEAVGAALGATAVGAASGATGSGAGFCGVGGASSGAR